MKLTILFLVAAFLQAEAKVSAQRISLHVKQENIQKVFKAIRQQTGFGFVVDARFLEQARPVTIEADKSDLQEVLRQCFENQPFTYEIQDRIVVVKERVTASVSGARISIQNTAAAIPVRGRVTNDKGEPIAGVTVSVKGSSNRTSTNDNGEFVLEVADVNAVLVFSAITIETYETKLNARTEINVSAVARISQLQEVIVNKGYYSTSQALNTGNVSKVSGEEIAKQPVSNALAALQGRVPGLEVIQKTGVSSGGYTVQIRGRNSIGNGNDPLYIIDGVPYISNLLNTLNAAASGGSPLNYINPSDIESIEVLKDADATAIYGSRGANGVVLISTKKGRSGNIKTSINVYSGVGKAATRMNWLNTQQYLQMRREGYKNDGITTIPTNANDFYAWDTTRYTDWQKTLIGGTAHFTDAQAAISGGNSNVQYVLGSGYRKETSVFPGNFYDQRGSVHFNINSLSNDKRFRVTLFANYIVDNNNSNRSDPTSAIPFLAPDAPPVYNNDGSLNWANSTWLNPFASLLYKFKGSANNLVSNASLSYEIFKGIQLKTSLGYNHFQTNEIGVTPLSSTNPAFGISSGNSDFYTSTVKSWIIEPQILYQVAVGKNLVTALVGTSFQKTVSNGQMFNATGFSSDAQLENIQAAATITASSTTNAKYRYHALFGRVQYSYAEKYLVNITARRDGSSRFGPGKQFANFGAIGAGWIFSKENFIQQNLSFLSFGKLRASYGTSGNDQIGDYRYLDIYNSTQYPYQGVQGLYANNLFNADFAWEINKKIEAAIELGFLKDRIFISASYYRNRSSNQLINSALPAMTGFTSVTKNLPATVENAGLEFLLNTANIKSKDFSWTSTFNITIPRNKLIAFPNLENSNYASSFVVGQSINIVRAFHLIGVDPQTGIYQFADSKGNATLNPSFTTDRTVTINVDPKFYGGFKNTIQYKAFSLDVLFQFVHQTGPLYLFNTLPGFYFSSGYNQPTGILDRWQKPGDITSIQRFTATNFSLLNSYRNASTSDLGYGDASFVRLKNLSLSWQIPKSWQQKLHLLNCRFYLQAQNLFTITNYKGFDPENQSSRNLPPLKVITGGFEINF